MSLRVAVGVLAWIAVTCGYAANQGGPPSSRISPVW